MVTCLQQVLVRVHHAPVDVQRHANRALAVAGSALAGELDELIDALIMVDQAERLSGLVGNDDAA